MNNLLVISGMYLPTPSANGACLDAILKGLFVKGYYAHVVTVDGSSQDYTSDYCKVYPVIRKERRSTSKVINKIKSAIYQFLYYPLTDKIHRTDIYNKCKVILNETPIDFILCVQKPAICGYIGSQLKREYGQIPVVLYELDSLTDNFSNHNSWTQYLSKRNVRLEQRIYSDVDLILHMRGHSSYYEKLSYDEYRNKSAYVDIPLIESEVYSKSVRGSANCSELIYSGVLMKEFRSPEYLIKVFSKVVEMGKNMRMDFYSRGNCEVYLKEMMDSDLKGHIFVHGYIPKDELDDKCAKTDVLLSIGNSFNDIIGSLPSKILYYMSLGKPIIHIAPNKYDLCISYLQRYPKALILYEDDELKNNVEKFVKFTDAIDGTKVDFEFIKEEFKENTAVYTVNVILSTLKLTK